MPYRFKSFILTSLVLSLSHCANYNNLLIPGAFAQTVAPYNNSDTDKLFQQGLQQYRLGQYPQALSTYQRVLENYKRLNDQAKIAQTLNNIGEVYLGLDQYDKALEVLQTALNTRRQLKDRAGEGETLCLCRLQRLQRMQIKPLTLLSFSTTYRVVT
jgi:tetratricopeptide (TPR) repeat protein